MDNIFEEIKKSLKDAISGMDVQNLNETKTEVDKYFNLATVMIDIMEGQSGKLLKQQIAVPEQENAANRQFTIKKTVPVVLDAMAQEQEQTEKIELTEESQAEKAKEVIDELAKSFEEEKKVIAFPFDRKLSGGFLMSGAATTNIFIPEVVVRNEGFESGDLISAEPISSSTYRNQNYEYTLVKKAETPVPSIREEFAYGIVDYDESLQSFFVEKNTSGEFLRIDGTPMKFMIQRKGASSFDLAVGDIVDIAWYTGNLEKGKIVWKYKVEDNASKTESKKIADFNKKQKVEPKEVSGTEESLTPQTLTGKNICVIGADQYHSEFKAVIEEHGGSFSGILTGTHKVSMAATIRKSDLVMVCISHTTHRDSQYANEKAKSYKVPFKAFTGLGRGVFLATIYNVLKIQSVEEQGVPVWK